MDQQIGDSFKKPLPTSTESALSLPSPVISDTSFVSLPMQLGQKVVDALSTTKSSDVGSARSFDWDQCFIGPMTFDDHLDRLVRDFDYRNATPPSPKYNAADDDPNFIGPMTSADHIIQLLCDSDYRNADPTVSGRTAPPCDPHFIGPMTFDEHSPRLLCDSDYRNADLTASKRTAPLCDPHFTRPTTSNDHHPASSYEYRFNANPTIWEHTFAVAGELFPTTIQGLVQQWSIAWRLALLETNLKSAKAIGASYLLKLASAKDELAWKLNELQNRDAIISELRGEIQVRDAHIEFLLGSLIGAIKREQSDDDDNYQNTQVLDDNQIQAAEFPSKLEFVKTDALDLSSRLDNLTSIEDDVGRRNKRKFRNVE